MKRIIIHWTAGGPKANNTDKKHYHYIINQDLTVTKGDHDVLDNENCKDGDYAAHTGQGNTSSIGVSLAGMLGFSMKTKFTKYPINKKQLELMFYVVASLADIYNIVPSLDTIDTHFTFNEKHNIHTGKIDIVYLPPYPRFKPLQILPFIVNKINWYYSKIKNGEIKNYFKK